MLHRKPVESPNALYPLLSLIAPWGINDNYDHVSLKSPRQSQYVLDDLDLKSSPMHFLWSFADLLLEIDVELILKHRLTTRHRTFWMKLIFLLNIFDEECSRTILKSSIRKVFRGSVLFLAESCLNSFLHLTFSQFRFHLSLKYYANLDYKNFVSVYNTNNLISLHCWRN